MEHGALAMRLWEILRRAGTIKPPVTGDVATNPVSPGDPDTAVLPAFSQVVLSRPYNHNGLSLPAGATGVVTDVLPQLKAYTVEFGSPYACVETVAMGMVKPANG